MGKYCERVAKSLVTSEVDADLTPSAEQLTTQGIGGACTFSPARERPPGRPTSRKEGNSEPNGHEATRAVRAEDGYLVVDRQPGLPPRARPTHHVNKNPPARANPAG